MKIPPDRPIALALSGGGIRAMVFHLGTLRYLAERSLLERITHISSVSGGSLIVGLIIANNRMRWPTSREYLDVVLPALQTKLCQRSLQWGALRQLLRPRNWRYVFSRANLLASALKREWQVDASLADLPEMPEWSINGTNAENGRRFRFKRNNFGDYLTGYAPSGGYPLANAMAVSAAFPGGFGPLALEACEHTWHKRRNWSDAEGTEQPVECAFRRLHLYDGGVYDNLGLEPYFDAGKGVAKLPQHFVLASDAGLPLSASFSKGALNPGRLKRVADIMSDQARALRVRTFVHFVTQESGRGAFAFIGATGDAVDLKRAEAAKTYPTTLRRMPEQGFCEIEQHGWEAAGASLGT